MLKKYFIAQIKPLYAIEFTRAVKANYSPSVERNCREQIRGNHPVRLRLPPLHRRGMSRADTMQPPRQAAPATPPQEGNVPRADTMQAPRQAAPATPPQEGNCQEQIRGNHPVRLRLPPLHRRGIAESRYEASTSSGCACHPSRQQSPQGIRHRSI